MALGLYPLAVAIAFRVVVELMGTLLHAGEFTVGVLPSVVQRTVAPEVASDRVTVTVLV
jgi:hypothetical protein